MVHDSHDVTLAEKCLAVSKLLVATGQPFKFSLKQGNYNFFISTMVPGKPDTMETSRKKSPSTLKRNASRQEDHKKKEESKEKEMVKRESELKENVSKLKAREDSVLIKEKENEEKDKEIANWQQNEEDRKDVEALISHLLFELERFF